MRRLFPLLLLAGCGDTPVGEALRGAVAVLERGVVAELVGWVASSSFGGGELSFLAVVLLALASSIAACFAFVVVAVVQLHLRGVATHQGL